MDAHPKAKSVPGCMDCSKFFLFCFLIIEFVALPGGITAQDTRFRETLPAVVALVPLNAQGKPLGSGSGTLILPTGMILTNYHVVGDLETRQLYHPKGEVAVFAMSRTDEAARYVARAQVVQVSPNTDLAMLVIVANARGEPVDARSLNLLTAPLGNSDGLEVGDRITLLGFPGIGNRGNEKASNDYFYVTATPASVSGFHSEGGVRSWIRTTDPVSMGNSGGAAVDANGCLVGVPSRGLSSQANLEKMGFIRPINYVPASWITGTGSSPRPCLRTDEKAATPAPTPAPGGRVSSQSQGVIFSGQIVDANTGRGISGATFAVIKSSWAPGKELQESDLAAGSKTDEQGYFQTTDPVARGATYYLVVVADGYQPRREQSLIDASVPDHFRFPGPIRLVK